MKQILVALMCCATLLAGCSKNDDDQGLQKVSDVTKKMTDPKFIEYCLTYFDTNNNGKLSMQEVEQVTQLDFTDHELGLTSLAGIEYFTNLEWLDCENNLLTELDLSHNTIIGSLYCSKNRLVSLKFPTEAPWGGKGNVLSAVHCSQNQLTELDLSFSGLLHRLSCWDNQLTSLKIGESPMLRELDCSLNKLTSLNLRVPDRMQVLDCSYNEYLGEVWLSEYNSILDLTKDDHTKIVRFNESGASIKVAIPDLNFKNYLLSICDANGNGVISSEEAASVTEINIYNIRSYEGIEHLVNLKQANLEGHCRTLDLSKNYALTHLYISKLVNLKTLYLIAGQTYDQLGMPSQDVNVIYK